MQPVTEQYGLVCLASSAAAASNSTLPLAEHAVQAGTLQYGEPELQLQLRHRIGTPFVVDALRTPSSLRCENAGSPPTGCSDLPGPEPPFRAVKRPNRPYKAFTDITVENAKGA